MKKGKRKEKKKILLNNESCYYVFKVYCGLNFEFLCMILFNFYSDFEFGVLIIFIEMFFLIIW